MISGDLAGQRRAAFTRSDTPAARAGECHFGASSGIGEGTALHFASLGCWLSLTSRNQVSLQRVADACRARGAPEDKVTVILE
ncbi:hypothetical protein HPB50_005101 [Hyalomma asiaticum]|uniref:Uncharacterized protein n=1 Tax=Hyalomma asiaticum TaxID=266040 RepID=A0ACB7SCP6_HYAAI|nr:hypothetical protein HPB50_005101 [Hyalomma asiaticum]